MDKRLTLLYGRRSIRDYTPQPIVKEQIVELLRAAMAAPSAAAKDPWQFVVVQDPETLQKLAGTLSNGTMLLKSANAVVVCGDLEAAHDKQISYLLQDCSAAIQNLLLAAHGLGLGACWLGVHPRENRMRILREILGLPNQIIPVGVVALGYPAESKPPRTRYRDEAVHWEKW